MKKHLTLFLTAMLAIGGLNSSDAQQLPIFTQFPSDQLFFNPAVAGTKRVYDARINYRDQWVGFPDAPVTEGLSLNYRLLGGNKMGLGGYLYQDVTGPTQRNDYTLCYAYHIKFPDLVLSMGAAGSMVNYLAKGSKITIHQTYDPAIDQTVTSKAWAPEASAGLFLYNDRYQLGLSVDNMLSMKEKLYKKYVPDTSKLGIVELEPHFYGFLSYNFSGNPDYVWQSSLFAAITSGTPMYLAYSLRVHVRDKFYVGASYRMGDAVALDLGVTIHNDFEVCYSYDLVTSSLSHYTSGSHEITLIFSTDSFRKNNKPGDSFDSFQKKKYGYMF